MTDPDSIAIGGLTRFSTLDYPGHLAAVVFCQGCPWRCAYCHNPHLQAVTTDSSLPWHTVSEWLTERQGLLEAVVFSGGEPLLQSGLPWAMYQVREMGYQVGLHTAGVYPDRLAGVLPLVDWIGFDIKAAFDDYPRITGVKCLDTPQRALSYVLASGKPHEIRCTVDETLLSIDGAAIMARQIAALGVSRLVLQAKRDTKGKVSPISTDFVDAIAAWIPQVEQRPDHHATS